MDIAPVEAVFHHGIVEHARDAADIVAAIHLSLVITVADRGVHRPSGDGADPGSA